MGGGDDEVCEVIGDVDEGVVEEDTKRSIPEDLYENFAEIPTKQKHEGSDTPKMDGKTQRSEECTNDDGGRVVGVVLDDVGSEMGGVVSVVCDVPLPDPSPALEPPAASLVVIL